VGQMEARLPLGAFAFEPGQGSLRSELTPETPRRCPDEISVAACISPKPPYPTAVRQLAEAKAGPSV